MTTRLFETINSSWEVRNIDDEQQPAPQVTQDASQNPPLDIKLSPLFTDTAPVVYWFIDPAYRPKKINSDYNYSEQESLTDTQVQSHILVAPGSGV